MGVGKTTVAIKVAKKLNMEYIDTDHEIEQQHKTLISQIFQTKGEKHFREIESDIIKQVSKKENVVIATGGGVVIKKENISNLRNSGIIINLKCNEEKIFENISKDNLRPLLQEDNPKIKIKQLLKEREIYYKNNDYEIDVSFLSIDEVVNNVLEIYKEHKKDDRL